MARTSSLPAVARILALTCVVALPLATSGAAWAGDTSTAESLFGDGVNAMKRGDWKAACEAFGGSNDADPSPGAQVNLGLCNEKQGKLATAWGWYRSGAGLAEQRGSRDRADLARKEADRIEPKLRKLVINVKAPAQGEAIVRDGTAVPSAVFGREVPVDPGEHAIEASAPGKKPYKTTITVAAGPGVDRVEIPALEDEPHQAASSGAGAAGGVGTEPPREVQDDGSGQRTVGIVLGAFGLGAAITSAAFFYFDVHDNDLSKRYAGYAVNPEKNQGVQGNIDNFNKAASDYHKAAKTNEVVGFATAGGAVVLLGAAAYLYFTAGPKTPTKKGSLPLVTPWVTPTAKGAGLQLAF